jgi:hypothetical protein
VVTVRIYRCPDCPPDACEHIAGTRGPLPRYCPTHRRARELRRQRRGRSPLRIVQPDEVVPPSVEADPRPPQPDPEPEQDVPARGSIRQALHDDLAEVFSRHPAAATLERIADVLALVLDSPAALVVDPRIVPPLSRELRSIITELVTATDAEEDDLFGGAGPVVVGD